MKRSEGERFFKAISRPVIAGFLLLIATLFTGLSWFSHSQNQIALEDDARLAKAMLGTLSGRAYSFARDYAHWDEAIRNIFVARNDNWLRSSYYAGVDDIKGIDGLFVYADGNGSVLRYATNKADPLDRLERSAAGLAKTVSSTDFTVDHPYVGYSMLGDTLLVWGAFPFLAQNHEQVDIDLRGGAPVLVLYGKYPPEQLEAVAAGFNLQGFQAHGALSPSDQNPLNTQALGSNEKVGFRWTPRRPGDALMRSLLTPLAVVVAIAIYLYLRSRTTTQNLFNRLYAREAALSRQQEILVEHALPTNDTEEVQGDAIGHLLQEYSEVLGAPHTSFWTWSDDDRYLIRAHDHHIEDPFRHPAKRMEKEHCASLTKALKRGETIMVENSVSRSAFEDQYPDFSALVTDLRFLLCPVFLSGALVGILYAGHRDHGKKWTQEDKVFTRSAANIITLTLMFRQLEAARVAASDASQAKSLFLSNMSHELRTPLNAVIGFSDLLMQDAKAGKLPKDAHESLAYIHQSGVHLLDIVENILDFVSLGRGNYQVCDDLNDLPTCLGEAVASVQGDLDRKKVALYVDGLDDRSVRLDRRVIVRALEQLLSNAIKYSPEGGAIDVRLGDSTEDGHFAIIVQDQGPGMTRDQLAAATQPFYKADDSLTQKNGGTGVGLALVKSLVESQEGKLQLRSNPGCGTQAKLVFPLSRLHFSSGPPLKTATNEQPADSEYAPL